MKDVRLRIPTATEFRDRIAQAQAYVADLIGEAPAPPTDQ